jgi:hypothetical protein
LYSVVLSTGCDRFVAATVSAALLSFTSAEAAAVEFVGQNYEMFLN